MMDRPIAPIDRRCPHGVALGQFDVAWDHCPECHEDMLEARHEDMMRGRQEEERLERRDKGE